MASSSDATRVHDVAADEGGQLGERHRDATGAVEVGVVPDRADHAEGQEGGVLLADRAVGLPGLDDAHHVVDVLLRCPGGARR